MSEERSERFMLLVLGLVVVALIVGIITWSKAGSIPKVDEGAYQAVFLANNQQYFGHLRGIGTGHPYLTDIYYVKYAAQSGVAENTPQQKFTLVKLGSEIHGPQDVLYLNWDNLIFWENLKNDSQVVRGIEQEKAQRAQGANAGAISQEAPPATGQSHEVPVQAEGAKKKPTR